MQEADFYHCRGILKVLFSILCVRVLSAERDCTNVPSPSLMALISWRCEPRIGESSIRYQQEKSCVT